MESGPFEVTVIVPTVAEASRRQTIHRALRSIVCQEGVAAVPLIVANGNRFDPELMDDLKARTDARFHYLEQGGLVGALKRGRELVDTPYFSFLDDDDEYLPHALRTRLAVMRENDDVDAVVGNGFRERDGQRSASARNIEDARTKPLEALLDNNWLTSCGGLYRTSSIAPEYFDSVPAYAEWTYLAYKLCVTRKLAFVNDPAYIVHETAGSLSKSSDYGRSQANILERILMLDLPAHVRRRVKAKFGAALHSLAASCLETRNHQDAWRYHWRSLLQPEGLRYVAYTRKLLGL